MIRINELRIDEENRILHVDIEGDSNLDTISFLSLSDYLKEEPSIIIQSISLGQNKTLKRQISLSEDVYPNTEIIVMSAYMKDGRVYRELVFPVESIYKKSICYLNDLNKTCELPKRFIDYILITEWLYRSKDYDLHRTLKYWNKLMSNVKLENSCSCG